MNSLLPLQWNAIVDGIRRGQCVAFLGAGVNYGYLPLGGEVALKLVGKLFDRQIKGLEELIEIIPKSDFQQDAQYERHKDLTRVALQDLAKVALRYEHDTDMQTIINTLKDIIFDAKCQPSPLLRTLAELPFKLIITTNYDRLLERALELFSANDLKDATGLLVKINSNTDSLAQLLKESFSPEIREGLDQNNAPHPDLPKGIIEEINRLMQEKSLYHLEGVSAIPLSDSLRQQVNQAPSAIEHIRRNRHLLENSFPAEIKPHNKPYRVITQTVKKNDGKMQTQLQAELADYEGLVIYKIHGSFRDEEPDESSRIIVTEEDYIEFLAFIGGEGHGIDNQIMAKLVDSTLLFLGYSLEDWNFRVIFKGLIEALPVRSIKRRKSFAIQKDPTPFWKEYWEKKNVVICNLDLANFASELDRRYRTQ